MASTIRCRSQPGTTPWKRGCLVPPGCLLVFIHPAEDVRPVESDHHLPAYFDLASPTLLIFDSGSLGSVRWLYHSCRHHFQDPLCSFAFGKQSPVGSQSNGRGCGSVNCVLCQVGLGTLLITCSENVCECLKQVTQLLAPVRVNRCHFSSAGCGKDPTSDTNMAVCEV